MLPMAKKKEGSEAQRKTYKERVQWSSIFWGGRRKISYYCLHNIYGILRKFVFFLRKKLHRKMLDHMQLFSFFLHYDA